jgi:hypothetical protein
VCAWLAGSVHAVCFAGMGLGLSVGSPVKVGRCDPLAGVLAPLHCSPPVCEACDGNGEFWGLGGIYDSGMVEGRILFFFLRWLWWGCGCGLEGIFGRDLGSGRLPMGPGSWQGDGEMRGF